MPANSGKPDPTKFDSVWISSPEHLQRLGEIVSQSSWLDKLLLRYKTPEDFPRIRMAPTLPWGRFRYPPAAWLAIGKIRFRPKDLLFFTAPPVGSLGNRLENVKDLRLEIGLSEIVSVQCYDPPEVVSEYCPFPWTRLHTSQAGLASDVLICVGGLVLSPRQVRGENARLFRVLSEMVDGSPTGTTA